MFRGELAEKNGIAARGGGSGVCVKGVCLRWQVHGTDVATGEPMTLGVTDGEASRAVHTAISKSILVSRVSGDRLRRTFLPLACAGVILLTGLSALLFTLYEKQELTIRAAAGQNENLTAALAKSDATMASMESLRMSREGVAQLEAAQARSQALEQELAKARAEVTDKERLRGELQAALAKISQLAPAAAKNEVAARHYADKAATASNVAESAQTKLEELQQSNAALTHEIDVLKAELLTAAALPNPATASTQETEPADTAVTHTPMRWAMRVSYDTAANFLAMHFDRDGMHSTPLADGTIAWAAASSANATSTTIVHDAAKQRVYSATLCVSLASDAPQAKLDENLHLIETFLHDFAPAMKDPNARTTHALQQLADRAPTERIVLLNDDSKLTLWNNAGLYSLKIESIGNDLDDVH